MHTDQTLFGPLTPQWVFLWFSDMTREKKKLRVKINKALIINSRSHLTVNFPGCRRNYEIGETSMNVKDVKLYLKQYRLVW